MFIPGVHRIEVKPLIKMGIIADTKKELVELGEVVSLGANVDKDIASVGDILAFEGWGCSKILHEGEEKWVVSSSSNVILGRYAK